MSYKLKEFFKENDVKIGEGKDFKMTPPVYYLSLNNAFQNYFLSIREKKDTYHFLVDVKSWDRQSLAFNYAGDGSNTVFAILNFHRFIELLLKDILRRINPFLAVKFLERESELFKFFGNKIEADEIKTIEFNETLKRFKEAFKYYKKDTEIYNNHLKAYGFLIEQDNLDTLGVLVEWRNRIMHNGAVLPNIFAFEYLTSQRLIPLIKQIVIAEKPFLSGWFPHFYKTKTDINIIEEIVKIKFHFSDFKNTSKSNHVAHCLLKLAHLKELGRATYNQDNFIRHNRSVYEPYYENPIGRSERFANAERNHENFYNIENCLCCGTKSMVVYRKEFDDLFGRGRDFISWFKCYNCDYSLKNNLGDPSYFGFCEKSIFALE